MLPAVRVFLAPRTIVAVLAVVAAVVLVVRIVDVLLAAAVAIIIAAALGPAVHHFHRRLGGPRVVAVLAVFGLMLSALALVGLIVVPALIAQAQALAQALPEYTARLNNTYAWLVARDARFHMLPDLQVVGAQVSARAAGWLSSGVDVVRRAAGAIATLSIVLVATFFLLLEGPSLREGLLELLPSKARRRAAEQVGPITAKLGGYVQGLGISIGFLTAYLGLAMTIAGVPMALVLALFAGMLELIPMVGSLLGSIPAILVACTVSWKLGLVTAAIFAAGNVIQGNLVAPFAFSRSVALSPLLVLFALLVGGELFGFAGALIAVPVMATIQVLVQNLYLAPRARRNREPRVLTFDEPLPVQPLTLEEVPTIWSVRLPDEVLEEI